MAYLTELDPSQAALVVIDMQKGWLAPDGGFAKSLGFEASANQRGIIPNVRELVRLCHDVSIPVIWVQQVHFEGDATRKQRIIPSHLDKRSIRVCIHGTTDPEIVDDLIDEVRPDEDYFVEKHRASAFYNTTLETKLKMLGRRLVIISGINSNYCVDSTVRDAYFREFDVICVKDCVAGTFTDLHEAFLKNFDIYFGDSFTLEEMRGLVSGSLAGAAAS
jgi:ureidoacrylate peracid hydrolase